MAEHRHPAVTARARQRGRTWRGAMVLVAGLSLLALAGWLMWGGRDDAPIRPEAGMAFDVMRDASRPVRLLSPPALVALPVVSSARLVFFEISPDYKAVRHHLREAARQYGVDYELLQAVIATESGFDARAVSRRGAVGLMQLMPATAARWIEGGDPRQPLDKQLSDPRANIQAGARHLRYLLDRFPGRIDLALAAYNAGEGAVLRAGNQIPPYGETRRYVEKVMTLYAGLRPAAGAPVTTAVWPVLAASAAKLPGSDNATEPTMIAAQR